jgi:Xaa-Pro aminopeptidase
MGDGDMAVIPGERPPRAFEVFRQTNTFAYCCGLEAPRAYLVIRGSDGGGEVYLPSRGKGESAEGRVLGCEDADEIVEATGLNAVRPLDELAEKLREAERLHTPFAPAEGWKTSRDVLTHGDRLVADDPWDGAVSREARFVGLLMARCPGMPLVDLMPIIDELRAIKSPAEVALCREAGRLSALAVSEAMRATRPGLHEYHLQAVAEFVYLAGGARGEGYRAIIASGENAWYGHYNRNDSPLIDGQMLLMDCAPDYRYYTSDIGRMWPVNGRWADWQRELYGFVVEYHKVLLSLLGPGKDWEAITAEAAEAMRPVHADWSWSKAEYGDAAAGMFDFRGHLSHPVGMAVHDLGTYRKAPLRPGTVLTIDPMLWVPDERQYVRCEDTVVITEEGIENLTASAPLELDLVEATVGVGPELALA